MPRAAGAAFGAFIVLAALSGCSAAAGDGGLGDWTSSIGARWERFVDGNLAPLTDAGIAIAGWWVGLAVAARIVTLLPGVRDLRLTRAAGRRFRTYGWALVLATPIATVFVTVFARDALLMWGLVGGVLATVAVCVLAPGLATRSRIDAHVIAPGGSANEAWSIDALLQVRDLNADDPGRVERQNSPDFGEFITVADRSGNGLASVVAWLVQVLFNSSPWMLQVAMVDADSAIATIRRNGASVGEVQLQLGWRGVRNADEADQHRKLLALAAAFTAMTMAERYPDVRGFYGARNWRSLGYLGIAQMAADAAERDYYLNRALELEPRSLLVEYRRVLLDSDGAQGRRDLEALMDHLEPVVNQVASVCGAELVFDAEPRDWHDYVERSRKRKQEEQREEQARLERKGPNAEFDRKARRRERTRTRRQEPRIMLLRTLMLYSTHARNWAAQVELHGVDDDVATRRAKIRRSLERLVELLALETAERTELTRLQATGRAIRSTLRPNSAAARRTWENEELERRDQFGILLRMRARAALAFVIFSDGSAVTELVSAADPIDPNDAAKVTDAASRRLSRPPRHAAWAERRREQGRLAALSESERQAEVRDRAAALVRPWLDETKASCEIEIRYSYACYLARRSRTAENRKVRENVVSDAVRRVSAAQSVDYYRGLASWDPELKLLGDEQRMRDLVLRPIRSPWEISRFSGVRGALAGQGILEPDGLAAASGLDTLLESTAMRGDEFGMLLDASMLLRVIETTDAGGLDPEQRLRAARYLIDVAAYSVRCLLVRFEQDSEAVTAEIAEAVFWVPTPVECTNVEEFLKEMVGRLAAERAAAEGAAGADADARVARRMGA
ncbi:hypothetical protein [Agromyces sp. Leaf222]|uniref:hypothetical protein n=1 Tax=Agromyces sp. Leaf222 TaxID=1735688 RepID=UPI0006FDD0DC|nr:hypothetical protein [Agromyces sp. Leaf222]KQM82627.1 hypothetical protein ASE68_04510 [Agromyces sp. Leaf222]